MRKRVRKSFREKITTSLSTVFGTAGVLGSSFPLCHNVCMGLIAALSAIGIVITGFPLLFLFKYNIYFWSAAVILLIPTLYLYLKNRGCMPKNIILFNVGIVIAATPFAPTVQFNYLFWSVGGILAGIGILGYIRTKFVGRWDEI